MNKKLMVLAVAGAFAAPALVHAQASTVSIYGRFNVHFTNIKASGTDAFGGPARPSRNQVSNFGGTAIGFRGEEKLGGGLSAIFQVESNVTGDGTGGANTFASRNSGVGLKGGFGAVILGIWDTPYKQVLGGLSQTGRTNLAGINSIMGNGNVTSANPTSGNGSVEFSRRARNAVYYTSPSWSGFQAKALYGANEEKRTGATGTNPSLWSFSAGYRSGPLSILGAYDRHNDYNGRGADDTGWIIGGTYTFAGATKIGVAYEKLKYEIPTPAILDVTRKAWMIQASHKFGPHTIIGSYIQADDLEGSPLAAAASAFGVPQLADTGAKHWSITYKYAFSKRTSLVATYGKIDNDRFGVYDFGGASAAFGGLGGAAGLDPKGYGIGLDHRY